MGLACGHVHKPTEKKERNVLSEDKNKGNLTRHVHKAKRESPQKHGLPGKKKGDRENLSPVCGGALWTLVQFHTNGTCYLVTGSCVCSA